jgi:hypothetical protein
VPLARPAPEDQLAFHPFVAKMGELFLTTCPVPRCCQEAHSRGRFSTSTGGASGTPQQCHPADCRSGRPASGKTESTPFIRAMHCDCQLATIWKRNWLRTPFSLPESLGTRRTIVARARRTWWICGVQISECRAETMQYVVIR